MIYIELKTQHYYENFYKSQNYKEVLNFVLIINIHLEFEILTKNLFFRSKTFQNDWNIKRKYFLSVMDHGVLHYYSHISLLSSFNFKS